jgi:predicted TIM-barrel fold metal-dependent hydrolase
VTVIKTDFHVHAFPPGMVPLAIHRARAVSRAVRLGRDREEYVEQVVERMQRNIDDPYGDHVRRDLEACGIRRAAMIGIDWGLVDGDITELTPAAQLEWARECATRHAGFYFPFFGLDPRRPDAESLARQALADPVIVGIKLYPPTGFSPVDERCDAVYRAVVDAGAVVMFHTGRQTYPFDLAQGRLEPYADVQRRFPALRLVLGHAGWPFWGREAVEVAAGHPDTWIEVSNWHRGVEHDLAEVQAFLRHAWRELGPRRVLYGTDAFSSPRGAGPGLARWKEVFETTADEAGVDLAPMEAAVDELLVRAR